MKWLQWIPIVLSPLLLAAHFLRRGDTALVAVSLILFLLLAVRHRFVRRVVQAGFVLGALEWVHTLVTLASMRLGQGVPVGRLVLILGSVALVTLMSALLLQTRASRRWYRVE